MYYIHPVRYLAMVKKGRHVSIRTVVAHMMSQTDWPKTKNQFKASTRSLHQECGILAINRRMPMESLHVTAEKWVLVCWLGEALGLTALAKITLDFT